MVAARLLFLGQAADTQQAVTFFFRQFFLFFQRFFVLILEGTDEPFVTSF